MFILGKVYKVRCSICLFNEKLLPFCLLILIKHPLTQKYTSVKKKFKNRDIYPAKTASCHKNLIILKVRQFLLNWVQKLRNQLWNPLFTRKSKKENSRLIGMVRMIESISRTQPPTSSSRRHF